MLCLLSKEIVLDYSMLLKVLNFFSASKYYSFVIQITEEGLISQKKFDRGFH